MLRISLVLGAILAIALPASVASAQSGKLRVFFPNDCQQNVYKPKSFVVTCADANFEVQKVKYSKYGKKVARGTGTARINDCEPNCAAGTFKKYPVRFKLSRVRQCGDVPQFRRLTVIFTGKRPAGEDRRLRQPFQCADAPTR